MLSLTKHLSRIQYLVEECLGGASIRTNIRIYFSHRHVRDIILILEEVNQHYPRCLQCDMFVPQKALNGRNLATDFCQRGMEIKWRQLMEKEARARTERPITAYGAPLPQVTYFKYLGRVIVAEDDNWTAVVRNLRRARQKWARLNWILSRDGEDAQTLGKI